jgi:glycosyltransferase involved in cell wall biosynthesis
MRIAYWSPLPPQRSGIADYSAELLPHLAAHLEVDLVLGEGPRPEGELARFRSWPARELARRLAAGECAAVLYHLGNNRDFHRDIYRTLLARPGIVVLHEVVLHHLVRDLTLHSGDPAGYLAEMRYAYGRSGEALARRALATGVPLDPWSFPLFERVADRSLGLLVHNETTAQRVLASRPDARLARVPHHLSLAGLPRLDRAAARAALGLPADALLIATFGFFTAAKRLDVLLPAFARLRRELPHARLLLVGEVSPHYDFARVFRDELRPGVTLVGRTELPEFLLHMAAADLAVNLRFPTSGETSGTLIRLLGMGRPVIVSRTGAFAEIPDDCCAKVDLDDTEGELLFACLRLLATDEPLRRRMGENARRHIATHHTLEGSARACADFVRRTVEAAPRPFRALPPLAPYPEDDLLSDLVAEVSAELCDLVGPRAIITGGKEPVVSGGGDAAADGGDSEGDGGNAAADGGEAAGNPDAWDEQEILRPLAEAIVELDLDLYRPAGPDTEQEARRGGQDAWR